MTAPLGDVLFALAVILVVVGCGLFALRLWISTFADLIWMAVLRPTLALPVIAGIAFLVLVSVYSLVPQRSGALFALPLLFTLIITPMLARPLANAIARRFFSRLGYAYELDRVSLRFADVFYLEDLQLRTRYTAPESKDGNAS